MAAEALQIDVYSHHVSVSNFGWEVKEALVAFAKQRTNWGPVRGFGGRVVAEMKSTYVGIAKNRTRFNFLLASKEELIQWLERNGFRRDRMVIIEHPLYVPKKVQFIYKMEVIPRDYQVPIIDYILEPGVNKMVELQTGKGKGKISMSAGKSFGFRTLIVIKPMYIEKWVAELEEVFEFKKGDLLVIRGAVSLKRLFEMARDGELEAKVIIIANATFRNYLDEYELFSGKENSYQMDAVEMWEKLGIGYFITDETHQDFHLNYRIQCYLHCPKSLALSATMESDDSFMNARYAEAYPHHLRSPKLAHDKYIAVEALMYEMENLRGIRTKNFFGMFNHILFEESIMKDRNRLTNYKHMVGEIIRFDYIQNSPPGTPMLVFFASIEMCTIMQQYLADEFPNKKVNRYVGEDEYEQLLSADIVVTTLKSAGTAVDIPNLSYVLMTVFVSSKQANLQGLGRLRPLKDHPSWTPLFAYLTAKNVDKAVQYMEEKMIKFTGKVVSHKQVQTQYRI
jgi:superfamily II DNA or RNA helicase